MALDSNMSVQVPDDATSAEELLQEDFSDLADDIQAFLRRFWVAGDDEMLATALWVIHTWRVSEAHTTPYLYINGERESGKTRLLDVLECLAYNAERADDMTPRVMFELIERDHGAIALLIDEVDTIWSGSRNEPKRRILNTGYKRGGTAHRMVAREPKEYSTFCPKVLCGIYNGKLPETLEDRCIPIETRRKDPHVQLERFIAHKVAKDARLEALLDRIFAFGEHHYADLAAYQPVAVKALSDRQNEITEPLLTIAAVLGIEDQARAALTRLFRNRDARVSSEQVLLGRIRAAFDSERVSTEQLCEALGPPWNGRQLALWLEQFGIAPKDIRFGNRVAKGYERAAFAPAFERYLEEPRTDTDDEEEEQ